MKKILTLVSTFAFATALFSDMVWDPAIPSFYSIPRAAGVYNREYSRLVRICTDIGLRLSHMEDAQKFTIIKAQIFDYLKRVGTPTALRLKADLEKNRIIFPDGTFYGPFFIK